MEVFRLFGTIAINKAGAIADMQAVEGHAAGFGSKLTGMFAKMATLFVGIFAVKKVKQLLDDSLAEFKNFQQGMSEVFTLMPGLDDLVKEEMVENVKLLAEEMGILSSEVVPALYQAISAGVPQENVFEFLEVAGQAAIGGVTDLETAVDGLSSIVNAYGSEVISAGEAADIMFTTVRLGKTTMEELSASVSTITPVAAQLGINFSDIGVAIAEMTSQGMKTPEALTYMRQMLVEMAQEGTDVADAFNKITGKSLKEFIAEGNNLGDALALIATYADDADTSLLDMFGRVQGGQAALMLTRGEMVSFNEKMGEMETRAGSLGSAYTEMVGTLQFQFNQLASWWENTKIDIGAQMQEPLETFTKWLNENRETIAGHLSAIFGALINGFSWVIDHADGVQVALSLITGGLIAMAAVKVIAGLDATKLAIMGIAAAGVGIIKLAQAFHDWREEADKARRVNEQLKDSMDALDRRMEQSAEYAGMTEAALGGLRREAEALVVANRAMANSGYQVETQAVGTKDEFIALGYVIQDVKDGITDLGVETGLVDRSFTDLEAAMMLAFDAMREKSGSGLTTFRDQATSVLNTLSAIDPRLKSLIPLLNVDLPAASAASGRAANRLTIDMSNLVGQVEEGEASFTEFGSMLVSTMYDAFQGVANGLMEIRDQHSEHQDALQDIKDEELARIEELAEARDADLAETQSRLEQDLISKEEYNVESQRILDEYTAAVQAAKDETITALDEEEKAYEDTKKSILEILGDVLRGVLESLRNELLGKAAAALAEAIGLAFIPGAQALSAAKFAQSGALAVGAAGLAVLGFEEGAIFDKPTMLPSHKVAEAGVSEVYLPLSTENLAKIGAGIAASSETNTSVSMQGMFDGATIHVRDDSDIRKIARETFNLWSSRMRLDRGYAV